MYSLSSLGKSCAVTPSRCWSRYLEEALGWMPISANNTIFWTTVSKSKFIMLYASWLVLCLYSPTLRMVEYLDWLRGSWGLEAIGSDWCLKSAALGCLNRAKQMANYGAVKALVNIKNIVCCYSPPPWQLVQKNKAVRIYSWPLVMAKTIWWLRH